jgi:putative transposase
MLRTYKYRLYPTKNQENLLKSTLDTCRILYNSCLLDRKNHYELLHTSLSRFSQQVILKTDKQIFPKLSNIHSQVLQDVLLRVDKAYNSFFRRLKSKTEKPGFPRLKAYNRYDSITYPQQPGFQILDNKLKLSKIGSVKLKLHRSIPGVLKTCNVRLNANRWYACIVTDIDLSHKKLLIDNKTAIGIDVGIKNFATLSDGTEIANPKHLRTSEQKLKKIQRHFSRKHKKSNNRNKYKKKLTNLHLKVRNQRLDFHHKVSRQLVNKYNMIIVENLQIKNMLKNHKLAKSISDAGWGQFTQFLEYKAEEAGILFERVDPKYTSINCSSCGCSVLKTLKDRTHTCPHCGLILDRDINAAINILNKNTVGTTEINA